MAESSANDRHDIDSDFGVLASLQVLAVAPHSGRFIFWMCIALMIAGFLIPGTGQIGAVILMMRS